MQFSRARFLGAAALGVGNSLLLAPPAHAATDDDLVLLRLAASAELVMTAFYYRARTSRLFDAHGHAEFRAAQNAHGAHYRALATAIGADAPTAADFEISIPRFERRRQVYELRATLEGAVVGVYVNAAALLSTSDLRLLAARAAASSATYAAPLAPFPIALDTEAAAKVFAPYWG